MGNFAAIVAPQTVAEVFGQADIKVFWMRFAFQNVNVMELHPCFATCSGVPSRSSERLAGKFRPAFALCATARQSSLLRSAPSEDCSEPFFRERPA